MCVAGNVAEWNCLHVMIWLDSMDLAELVPAFILRFITGDVLLASDDEMLIDLGVTSKVDRVKILTKVKTLAARLCIQPLNAV